MKVDSVHLNDLLIKLIKINQKHYPNPRKRDGDIGERFVKDSIKYYMWEKGFKLRSSGNRTFKIEGQYKAGRGGMGGIDFRFGFVHNNKRYDCFVESKNWGIFNLTYSMFQTEILNRFYKNVNHPGCIRIVTINRAYTYKRKITTLCRINNIYTVPIDRKITSNQLNTASLRIIMEHFLDAFDILMTRLTGVKLRKPKIKNIPNSKPYDKDILLGLPPSLIKKKYGSTTNNITKRKSQLKKLGMDVLDSRSSVARLARFLTKEQIGDIYRIMIQMIIEEHENR